MENTIERPSGMSASRRRNLLWQVPFLLFLIAGTVFIVRQQRSVPYQKDQGFVFGTIYHVSYQSEKNLKQEIEEVLSQVDAEFSMFNEHSTVSLINRGEETVLSPMFLEVYRLALHVNKETSGSFDITVAPLVNAWGFGFKHRQSPTPSQVDSLLQLVGMHHLSLDTVPPVLHKSDQRVMLDFSAIAKGYGSDCVARLLRRHHIGNFMVEIGGEVVTQGISPNRLPWRIGVTKPTDDSLQVASELQTVLNVTDRAMATSGNYRNFYYQNGRKYAHTINPKTGYPVQHTILSATVLAKDCAIADAYATSFMVMGLEAAKLVLDRHPELMAYFVLDNGEDEYAVWYSPSLQNCLND